MKLHEIIDYLDMNMDFHLIVKDEKVGVVNKMQPIYYEVYRKYNVSMISNNEIHIHNDGFLDKEKGLLVKIFDDDCGYFECPNCEITWGFMNEKEEYKYCPNCGQKLKWE